MKISLQPAQKRKPSKMSEESEVRAFYSGKNFFITGGTGFVGLCLIEKILRTIPDAGRLYLLMRPKKGKDISQRLEEFPTNPVSAIFYFSNLCLHSSYLVVTSCGSECNM